MAKSSLLVRELGEVVVETGTGRVDKLDVAERNAQLGIASDNRNLRDPVTGWIDLDVLIAAIPFERIGELNGARVRYRIETHRRRETTLDEVPFETPVSRMGNRQKTRRVVGLVVIDAAGLPTSPVAGRFEDPDGVMGPDRQNAAETAQDRRTAPPATDDAPTSPAAPTGGETGEEGEREPGWLAEAGREATAARAAHREPVAGQTDDRPVDDLECPLNETCEAGPFRTYPEVDAHVRKDHGWVGTPARPPDDPSLRASADASPSPAVDGSEERQGGVDGGEPQGAPPDPEPSPAPAARGRGRVQEGKPWEELNTDGSLNPGSYAFTAAMSAVAKAHELVLRHNRDLASGGPVETPRIPVVRSIARRLLEAADRVQANTREDGKFDRMDASHTRARGAVYESLDAFPVPWGVGADQAIVDAWLAQLTEHATGLCRLAFEFADWRRG